jgi:hypothetical protein
MSSLELERPTAQWTVPSELGEGDFTDDELAELALAADPDQKPDPDAVAMSDYMGESYGPLPDWYMPAPRVRGQSPLRTAIVLSIVVSLLLIEALGLCVTYGQLVAA